MTLKDYYAEKVANDSNFRNSEGWAVSYIDIRRARSILEAFDDDASGFVTINEVNNFVRSKPKDWRCALFLECARLTRSTTMQPTPLDSLLGYR